MASRKMQPATAPFPKQGNYSPLHTMRKPTSRQPRIGRKAPRALISRLRAPFDVRKRRSCPGRFCMARLRSVLTIRSKRPRVRAALQARIRDEEARLHGPAAVADQAEYAVRGNDRVAGFQDQGRAVRPEFRRQDSCRLLFDYVHEDVVDRDVPGFATVGLGSMPPEDAGDTCRPGAAVLSAAATQE